MPELTIEIQIKREKARIYRCEQCNSILGVLYGERNRSRLNVFRRYATEVQVTEAYIRDISNYVMLNLEQGTVICAWCGARKKWSMSDQALQDLLERRRSRKYGLELPG